MANGFQKDFRLTQVNKVGTVPQKVTLSLGPSGDLQTVESKDKLAEQLMRALVNDETMTSGILNAVDTPSRTVKTLITMLLRNFRQSQIYQTQASDPRVLGFLVYRFDQFLSSSSFVRISDNPVTYTFQDTNLQNGFSYSYGITKLYSTGLESAMLEQIDVTPTQFIANQVPVIGKSVAGVPGDKSVTLYVDYNRQFKYAELLESIEDIEVLQDPAEPRRYIVNVIVTSLDGNQLSISTSSTSK